MKNRLGTLGQAFCRFAAGLSRTSKQIILIAFDLCAIGASLALAVHSAPTPVGPEGTLLLFCGAPVLALGFFWAFGLYRSVVRSMGSHGPFAIGGVAILSAAFLAATNRLLPHAYVSADVIYRYCFFLLVLVGGGRLLARDVLRRSGSKVGRVLIYGAGEAGRQLADVLTSGPWRVVAFVDDDPQLHRATIRSARVYSPERLAQLVPKLRVHEVLLAMPRLTRRRRNEIIQQLLPLGVAVRSVPDLTDIVTGRAQVHDVKDVNVADVLGRDPVPPIERLVDACVRHQVVLITGAGGSIGSELSRQILRLGPKRLVLFELSEHALYQIERELRVISAAEGLDVDIVALLGSAHHKRRIRQILRTYSVNTIYHAAAYKHVPMVEANIVEGIHNNVISTWYTAEAAISCGVSTFVLVSTDKAVNPTNVMGATKRMAEIVLQGLQHQTEATRFCMVRFGNVLDSSGSVVPLFREQIRSGGPVTVTHPEVTRYFMTIPEAANLVLQAGAIGQGGDVFVLEMGSPIRIANLARRMIELSGLNVRDESNPDGDIEIRFTGLRPAEKLFEELVIGKNLSGTEHPRILRAVEHAPPWSQIEGMLNELLLALERLDGPAALAILKRAVIEYQPTNDPFELSELAQHSYSRLEHKGESNVSHLPLQRTN
jgi:FlaA1/EpsC-like NDP-sugar epimerase